MIEEENSVFQATPENVNPPSVSIKFTIPENKTLFDFYLLSILHSHRFFREKIEIRNFLPKVKNFFRRLGGEKFFLEKIYNQKSLESMKNTLASSEEEIKVALLELEEKLGISIIRRYFIHPVHMVNIYGMYNIKDENEGRETHAHIYISDKNPHPLETVIHELVHVNIEKIVREFGLSFNEKERLVDIICALLFGEKIPSFSKRLKGSHPIDQYVSKIEDLQHLYERVKEYKESSRGKN
jgi:hypothetical protein